jgi:hypothetical protein
VDAEGALIAALKVKNEQPELAITYVRQQNPRGDARHPSYALVEDPHLRIMPGSPKRAAGQSRGDV